MTIEDKRLEDELKDIKENEDEKKCPNNVLSTNEQWDEEKRMLLRKSILRQRYSLEIPIDNQSMKGFEDYLILNDPELVKWEIESIDRRNEDLWMIQRNIKKMKRDGTWKEYYDNLGKKENEKHI